MLVLAAVVAVAPACSVSWSSDEGWSSGPPAPSEGTAGDEVPSELSDGVVWVRGLLERAGVDRVEVHCAREPARSLANLSHPWRCDVVTGRVDGTAVGTVARLARRDGVQARLDGQSVWLKGRGVQVWLGVQDFVPDPPRPVPFLSGWVALVP